MKFFLALSSFAAVHAANDAFVVNRFYGTEPLIEGRIDPIISPGRVSNHVHTVMGGNGFGMDMSNDTALEATCTNSLARADKSNYWFPKLYFHDPTKKDFEAVPLYYAAVYYFFDKSYGKVHAYPRGLRMVVGNPNRRSAPSSRGNLNVDKGTGEISPIQFMCTTKNKTLHPFALEQTGDHFRGAGFPLYNCDEQYTPLRYDIHFPSCYNPAVRVDDHEKNMEWPTNGRCPAGFLRVPRMSIEAYWNTPIFADRWVQAQDEQPFVLAQGDPTGFGLHGDFISGWDEQFLQGFIDECNVGFPGFQACPNINENGGAYVPDSASCVSESSASEPVLGVLKALPGCNPIQMGPQAAKIYSGSDCKEAVQA